MHASIFRSIVVGLSRTEALAAIDGVAYITVGVEMNRYHHRPSTSVGAPMITRIGDHISGNL